MKIKYSDLNIRFQFEGYAVDALNIIFESFARTIPLHSHGSGCYEIHYISDGYGKLSAGNQFYEIVPNTLFVTGPHVEHAQIPVPQDPMEEYCIYLKVGKQQKTSDDSSIMDRLLATPFWFGQDTQELNTLVQRLFEELKKRRTGYLKQVELLLQQLMICVVRNYESGSAAETGGVRQNLDVSRSLVVEEYFLYEYQTSSLKELAERLGLSERQTQRLLLKYYGQSFQQKKVEARMSAATILLREKAKSITDTAHALGYSSLEHFSTEFRKYYGVSPSKFRAGNDTAKEPFL